eukprot:COSAG06_NODE_65587_length_256_cov_1.312102_1_plen_35_part_01
MLSVISPVCTKLACAAGKSAREKVVLEKHELPPLL